jgi:hypothetical protein
MNATSQSIVQHTSGLALPRLGCDPVEISNLVHSILSLGVETNKSPAGAN